MVRKEKTVGEILDKLKDDQKRNLEIVRSLIKDSIPDVVELMRQGKIAYSINGKDFAWISAFKKHIDLEFLCGSRMSSELLKGRGKHRNLRHIEIKPNKELNETELKDLLSRASEISC